MPVVVIGVRLRLEGEAVVTKDLFPEMIAADIPARRVAIVTLHDLSDRVCRDHDWVRLTTRANIVNAAAARR